MTAPWDPPGRPQPPPGGPPEEGGHGRRRALLIAAIAVIGVLIAGGLAFVLTADEAEAATQIFAEPVSSVGIDPFTPDLVAPVAAFNPPVGATPEFIDKLALAPVQTSSGRAGGVTQPVSAASSGPVDAPEIATTTGDMTGLYGGTEQEAVCDVQQLVDFLSTNPDKAAAWAEVHRIQPGQIAEFVDGLTVAVLTRDTLVTNHGFRDGRANPIQSLLQAGNAVLVDERGVPRVRCKCGNPLLEPEPLGDKVEVVGTAWTGQDLGQAVTIRPSTTVLTDFVFINVAEGVEGTALTRPAGSSLTAATPTAASVFAPTAAPAVTTPSPAPAAPTPAPAATEPPRPTAAAPAPSATPPPQPTATSPPQPTRVPPTPTPVPPTPAPTPTPTRTPQTEVVLTGQGSVSASSTFSGFPAVNAVDNNVGTSWFSTGPGAGPGVYTWNGPRAEFTEVTIIGNASHNNPDFRQGFGFASLAIEIYDGGTLVYSASGSGQGWQFRPNATGNRIVLIFTGHEDPTCGGFSELVVKGLV